LAERTSLVLKASPGSGKTTRVPPTLLKILEGEILVLEPRRLAAKLSAERVAYEMNETVGQTVGYQFRFENVESAKTRLRFLTEGILLRRLQGDPDLRGVSAVILDEFHERHLMTDAALAIVKTLQSSTRPDLRILVMSATLDSASVAEYLGQAPVLEVSSRPHPVEIHHQADASEKYLERQVCDAALRALGSDQDDGDILVFLPGMAEIRRAEQALNDALGRGGPRLFALHGQLSRAEQDQAIQKGDRRKIILSTNVAETSLTIEGVTTVIDSGLHRQAAYSWWSGLPALRTRPISRASAIQRAGRAGRTAPGRCYRLYTRGDFDARPAFERPEIQRADLAQTWLDLKSTGLLDHAFAWFEKPSDASLESARKLLYLLGALTSVEATGALTPMGRALAKIPIHPRLGRLILEAKRNAVIDEGVHLAALLSDGRLEYRDAIENLRIPLTGGEPQRAKARLLQISGQIPANVLQNSLAGGLRTKEDRIRFSLLTAFPDRVARVRTAPASASRAKANEQELLFSSGGSAFISESAESSELLIALDVQEEQRSNRAQAKTIKVRCVSPIREEWLIDLNPSLLEERDDFRWDSAREKVVRTERMVYGELTLSERDSTATAGEPTARVLVKNAIGADYDTLPRASAAEWSGFLARVAEREAVTTAFVRASLLSDSFPQDSATFEQASLSLREIFLASVGVRDLEARDWPHEILAARCPTLAPRVEQILPSTITLPSGRKAKIQYAEGQAPWVESRIQDFFGMKQAPRLLDGRLALTVHLLAPNYRAVQVTTDLAGFWKREYPELRKSLSRRYPRHAWPENPADATVPTPRGKN
jgi:ATP-dependent helicase HrpB